MSFSNEYDSLIRQYRIVLTVLRTPKLRKHFIDLLNGLKNNVSNQYAQAFDSMTWLNSDSSSTDIINDEVLGEHIVALKQLLGDNTILECKVISELPYVFEERKTLIRRICTRVFSTSSAGKSWLTEAEYNSRLAMLVDDKQIATVRRYSVDYRIVERSDDGARYWLSEKS